MNEQKQKKEWKKPEIYLLSSADDVNGGQVVTAAHEVHNGNGSQIFIIPGNTIPANQTAYDNAHS